MYKIIPIFILVFCVAQFGSAQINTPSGATVPFGTKINYAYGIKPTNLPTTGTYASSQNAADAYNTWKTNYLESCGGTPNKYRVRFDNPSETVSEGIAYGMLLAAYAADKAVFDGLWEYYKAFKDGNGLMHWKESGCNSISGTGSATDADLDAAAALRVAVVQWPSTTSYATDLSTLLQAIRTFDIQASSSVGPYQTNNGDNWGQGNTCRNPSYQSPGYYKVFGAYETSQAAFWTNAENASYTMLNANVNVSTGLVSNWCDQNGTHNSCNGADDYGWDACRFPWRMATDATWWNDPDALARCASLAAYIQSTGVANLRGPVAQAGGSGSYHSPAFVSTWAASLMGSNSSYQSLLNSAYTETVNVQDGLPYYFGNTLRCICLFQLTGNFWNPATITSVPNPCLTSGLTANAGANTSICPAGTVSRTASATGGSSPYTYIWSNGATSASQTFTPITTTTYTVTVTDANGCTSLASFTVTVNSAPIVNAGTDQSICGVQTTNLTATGAATYLWSTGATTATIGVTPTVTTTYTVTGTSSVGCKASDAVVVNVGAAAGTPTAPTSVAATDGTFNNKVVVSWSLQPCFFYRVYRNTTNNSNSATALGTWATVASYEDLTAVPGTLYYYWVKAANSSTGTSASAFSTNNTGYANITAPTNLAASDGTFTGYVRLTWTSTIGVYYKIFRSTSNNSSTATALTNTWVAQSSYNDNTATAGVTYYYWIKASRYTTGVPTSAYSNGDGGFRGVSPTIPTNVNATDGTYTDRVTVTWTGTTGTYFQVFRSTTNTTASALAISGWQNTLNYNDYTAVQGTTYYYWVKSSTNSVGANITGFSAGNAGFAAVGGGTAATTPNNPNASDGAYFDRVRIAWSGNGGNYFMVYRSTSNNSATATALYSVWVTDMFYDDFTAVAGTTYYYWVKAATSNAGANTSAFSISDSGYRHLPASMQRIVFEPNLFPNPAQDQLQFTWKTDQAQSWRVSIYDATGKAFIQTKIEGIEGVNKLDLDIHELSNGLYWFDLEGVLNGQVTTKPFSVLK